MKYHTVNNSTLCTFGPLSLVVSLIVEALKNIGYNLGEAHKLGIKMYEDQSPLHKGAVDEFGRRVPNERCIAESCFVLRVCLRNHPEQCPRKSKLVLRKPAETEERVRVKLSHERLVEFRHNSV